MSKPIAVIISDIHFTVPTLELASTALKRALTHANLLQTPLVIAGDTLDSKAIVRAEVANRLIEIFQDKPKSFNKNVYMLVGNHDLLNEKGTAHSLNFLKPYINVVQSPVAVSFASRPIHLIPYQSSPEAMQTVLDDIPKGSWLIIHQGVQTAFLGHYVQDNTSLPPASYADFRVISGHYHRAQDIKCGRPRKGAVGLFSYVGNPYSLSFGEAQDGPKGFQVLYDDGHMEQVCTNLRKHTVIEVHADHWWECGVQPPSDLLWIKITGQPSELAAISKQDVAKVIGHANFKLDKVPMNIVGEDLQPIKKNATDAELLDGLIDSTTETPTQKQYLKCLWREVLE